MRLAAWSTLSAERGLNSRSGESCGPVSVCLLDNALAACVLLRTEAMVHVQAGGEGAQGWAEARQSVLRFMDAFKELLACEHANSALQRLLPV